MVAFWMVISLVTITRGPIAPDPSGTWVLNQAKSDFGTASVPRQLVVRIEETGNLVSIMTLTVDTGGARVSFREYVLAGKPPQHPNLLQPINADPLRSEEWQVTPQGELVIRRVLTTKARMIPQRLVFERSARVE